MAEWDKQLYFEDVVIDAELQSVSIPLSLQRLVMEAGANRDLSSIHHDNDAAVATGAPGVYMNTYFIMGMIERLVREWMGLQGQIKKIGPLRMKMFNCVGNTVVFTGKVRQKNEEDHLVVLDIRSETLKGETVSAEATVSLPTKK
jgi:hypothetical protein